MMIFILLATGPILINRLLRRNLNLPFCYDRWLLFYLIKAPAFPMNTILSWKGLPGTNTLAYYKNSLVTAVKSVTTLAARFGTEVISSQFLNYWTDFISVLESPGTQDRPDPLQRFRVSPSGPAGSPGPRRQHQRFGGNWRRKIRREFAPRRRRRRRSQHRSSRHRRTHGLSSYPRCHLPGTHVIKILSSPSLFREISWLFQPSFMYAGELGSLPVEVKHNGPVL